jgi:hypothetical protein
MIDVVLSKRIKEMLLLIRKLMASNVLLHHGGSILSYLLENTEHSFDFFFNSAIITHLWTHRTSHPHAIHPALGWLHARTRRVSSPRGSGPNPRGGGPCCHGDVADHKLTRCIANWLYCIVLYCIDEL